MEAENVDKAIKEMTDKIVAKFRKDMDEAASKAFTGFDKADGPDRTVITKCRGPLFGIDPSVEILVCAKCGESIKEEYYLCDIYGIKTIYGCAKCDSWTTNVRWVKINNLIC